MPLKTKGWQKATRQFRPEEFIAPGRELDFHQVQTTRHEHDKQIIIDSCYLRLHTKSIPQLWTQRCILACFNLFTSTRNQRVESIREHQRATLHLFHSLPSLLFCPVAVHMSLVDPTPYPWPDTNPEYCADGMWARSSESQHQEEARDIVHPNARFPSYESLSQSLSTLSSAWKDALALALLMPPP